MGDILFYKHKSNNVKKERIPLYENDDIRFATEEEKAKLFDAIKENGYKWNPETKTLEKTAKLIFNNGDVVATTDGEWIGITTGGEQGRLIPTYCVIKSNGVFEAYLDIKDKWQFGRLATEEEKARLFQAIKDNGYYWNAETKTLEKLVEPKFKVGDWIKYRSGEIVYRIVQITEDSYVLDNLCSIPISIEHMYNLVPNKFDISTLVPFDSRVLVRDSNSDRWKISFWGYLIDNNPYGYKYDTARGCYKQCIPYEGNEHLLGKTDNCIDFYKNW